MSKRSEIVEYLNRELRISEFSDNSLNGLQFEGTQEISRIAVSVDAGESVLSQAVHENAQLLIVHHGIIWDRPLAWTGSVKRALDILYRSELNLYACHLPLDAHSEWGNNFTLARKLFLSELRPAIAHRGQMIACIGENTTAKTLDEISDILGRLPGALQSPMVLGFGPEVPKRLCILSGSGMDAIYSASELGFDTFITGEPKQFAYHFAKDNRLNVICAGHYATETVGVLEVSRALEAKFGLTSTFIDIPTGI